LSVSHQYKPFRLKIANLKFINFQSFLKKKLHEIKTVKLQKKPHLKFNFGFLSNQNSQMLENTKYFLDLENIMSQLSYAFLSVKKYIKNLQF